jgi:ABC-type uncharacterized transport system YnjBCD ATPase subunit
MRSAAVATGGLFGGTHPPLHSFPSHGLADRFETSGNLIQTLLNPGELDLSSIGQLFQVLWSFLDVTADAANNLSSALADKQKSYAAEKHSEAAKTERKLFVSVHPFRDPTSAAQFKRAAFLLNMMQLLVLKPEESCWMDY